MNDTNKIKAMEVTLESFYQAKPNTGAERDELRKLRLLCETEEEKKQVEFSALFRKKQILKQEAKALAKKNVHERKLRREK